MSRFIFIAGACVSGLGKGIVCASLGRLLKEHGYKVNVKKLDPYLCYDPGTLNPYEHGEVFVLSSDTDSEVDLDFGNYERFIDTVLDGGSSITGGKIYRTVLDKERSGAYLGQTVQVIPHVTDEIKRRIYEGKDEFDFTLVEVGGTVGDIESQPFYEAIRQIRREIEPKESFFVLVTLIPYVTAAGELKTKPTQHGVKELRSIGIQPDAIVCRTNYTLSDNIKKKISLFCDVDQSAIIENKTVKTIYEIPLLLQREGLDKVILEKLSLPYKEASMNSWREFVDKIKGLRPPVNIALVGKYTQLHDAYISVVEALNHAGVNNSVNVHLNWVNSENDNIEDSIQGMDGIIVPGGFGSRGVEGKIEAIKFARKNRVPFLGLCLGLQCATIEFARNVCGLSDANSIEFDGDTHNPVITLMDSQHNIVNMGGTMRLGSYPCKLVPGTKVFDIYGSREWVSERHRHRFEFNPNYRELLETEGLVISGTSPDEKLVEIIELRDHPFFVATQFHPEFKSRPNGAHPLFSGFIRAAKEYHKEHDKPAIAK